MATPKATTSTKIKFVSKNNRINVTYHIIPIMESYLGTDNDMCRTEKRKCQNKTQIQMSQRSRRCKPSNSDQSYHPGKGSDPYPTLTKGGDDWDKNH